MKNIIAAFLAITLIIGAPSRVFAGWPATIVANIPDEIKWVANELPQWTQQLRQAQDMLRAAQTVRDFTGDPKAAVRNLGEVSGILETVGRMTGDENLFELASYVRSADASLQDALVFQRELESTIEIAGDKRTRDVSAYEATLAMERIYNTARQYTKNERDAQKKIAGKLDDANKKIDDSIANPEGVTQNEILAQILQQQRLANLQALEAAKRANAQAEAEALWRSRDERLKAEAKAAAEKDALTESALAKKAAEEDAKAKAKVLKDTFQKVPEAKWDADKMFQRNIRVDVLMPGSKE